MNEAPLRLTRIPKGADLIFNKVSGAPGFWIDNKSEGRLQRFSKHAGNGPEVGRTLSHHGPFLGCYVCNITADQLTKLNLELSRKARCENHGAS